jgi:hypothetical protein
MSRSVVCDDSGRSDAGEHLVAPSTAATMGTTLPIVVVRTMRQTDAFRGMLFRVASSAVLA